MIDFDAKDFHEAISAAAQQQKGERGIRVRENPKIDRGNFADDHIHQRSSKRPSFYDRFGSLRPTEAGHGASSRSRPRKKEREKEREEKKEGGRRGSASIRQLNGSAKLTMIYGVGVPPIHHSINIALFDGQITHRRSRSLEPGDSTLFILR